MKIKYYRSIILCDRPIEGLYSFWNLFQIYPVETGTIDGTKNINHFPVYIEYWIDEDLAIKVNPPKDFEPFKELLSVTTLQRNMLKDYLRILTCVTKYRFFVYDLDYAWYLPVAENMFTDTKSVWGASIYYDSEKGAPIDAFSVTDYVPMEKVKHNEYFQPDGKPLDEVVKVSEFSHHIIWSYMNLDEKEMKYLNSAMTLINNGIDIQKKMKSLSFISFISSIETMVSLEHINDQTKYKTCGSCGALLEAPTYCEKCENPKGGVLQKFRDYFMKYIVDGSDPDNNAFAKKRINKLYDMRSKIAHQGELLIGDAFMDWDLFDEETKHIDILEELKSYARISICNWLLLHHQAKIEAGTGKDFPYTKS